MKTNSIKSKSRLWSSFLNGYATIFDFTGHQARRMFPNAFGYGDDTVTVSWKSIGDQIRESMQDYSG